MSAVEFRNVGKSYGGLSVLRGVSFSIERGEFVVFVGPSGCGKTTLLRMIAGLEEVTLGEIVIDNVIVNDVPASERGIAMVFQSYALYPHMTVRENMAFGLKMAHVDRMEIERRVAEAADMLQISQLLDRLPKQLSGGQRQRVAIGRAITRDPKVFLFDEPLSNLDAALRVATRLELAKLKQRMPDTTAVYVTHDQVEAMTLADRIVVMNAGEVAQIGTPVELYFRPANLFVAGFIGSPAMNFLKARIKQGSSGAEMVVDGGGALLAPDMQAFDGEVVLGIRPEDFEITKDPLVQGQVSIIENLGEHLLIYIDTGGEDRLIAKIPGQLDIEVGQTVGLSVSPSKIHVFSPAGLRLGAVHNP